MWRAFWTLHRTRQIAVGMVVVEQPFAYGDLRAAIRDYALADAVLTFQDAVDLLLQLDEQARAFLQQQRKANEGKGGKA